MIEENFGLTNIMKMIYTKESIEGFSLLQKHGFYISSIATKLIIRWKIII